MTSSSCSGEAGRHDLAPLERDGRRRQQGTARQRCAHAGQHVEHVAPVVGPEDVDAAASSARQRDRHLAVGGGQLAHGVPAVAQQVAEREEVARHVVRVLVPAQQRHVGVRVVPDQVTGADGAEEAAEAEERVEAPSLAQVLEEDVDRVDDVGPVAVGGTVEDGRQVTPLVDRELLSRLVDDADAVGGRAELVLDVEQGLLARHQGDPCDAVEVAHQLVWPADHEVGRRRGGRRARRGTTTGGRRRTGR